MSEQITAEITGEDPMGRKLLRAVGREFVEVGPDSLVIPVPLSRPFDIELTKDAVQQVWDTFIKPGQDAGELQSIEDRALMAILRAVFKGYEDAEARA